MFLSKLSLKGRAAFSALVVCFALLSFSCNQPGSPIEKIGEVSYRPLEAEDEICGTWQGAYGLSLYCENNFVWTTSASGKKLDSVEGLEKDDYVTLSLMNWSTYEEEENYFEKKSDTIFIAYKNNPNEGVLIFKANYAPYGSPVEGCYYGIKYQIDSNDKNKALIEGGYNNDDIYNNITKIEDAVELFDFDNEDYFASKSWNEASSGATRK